MDDIRPPLEYLITCSKGALESIELARLSQASNLRKELRQVLEKWIDSEVDARLARWILESRRVQTSTADARSPKPGKPVLPEQLVLSFLPSFGGSARCVENVSSPTATDHKLTGDVAGGSARPQFPIGPGRLAHAEWSMPGRGQAVVRSAEAPGAASGRTEPFASRLVPVAKSAEVVLRALEHVARYHGPQSPKPFASVASENDEAPSRKLRPQDLALLRLLRRQPQVRCRFERQTSFRLAKERMRAPASA
jgi:hypothetical protein